MDEADAKKVAGILGEPAKLHAQIGDVLSALTLQLPPLPKDLSLVASPIVAALASVHAVLPTGLSFPFPGGFSAINQAVELSRNFFEDFSRQFAADLAETIAKAREARATWCKWAFRDGLRCVVLKPYEWDFRAIGSEHEAKRAWFYEYGREVEWLYRFAESVLDEKMASTDDRQARLRYLDSWILFELPLYWPVPWMLLRGKSALVYPPRQGASSVVSVDTARWREMIENGAQGRLALLEIDWERGLKTVCEDFKKWARHAAPRKTVGAKRGKRVNTSSLLKLKWLAAYRLSRAGMSYTKAKALLDAARKEGGDAHALLPTYASAGGWDDAVKKAQALLREQFAEPPARPEDELAE